MFVSYTSTKTMSSPILIADNHAMLRLPQHHFSLQKQASSNNQHLRLGEFKSKTAVNREVHRGHHLMILRMAISCFPKVTTMENFTALVLPFRCQRYTFYPPSCRGMYSSRFVTINTCLISRLRQKVYQHRHRLSQRQFLLLLHKLTTISKPLLH